MSDKNLLLKSAGVVLLLLLAAWNLYPPQARLKGGIDLVGGHSLLYEIDTAGLEEAQKSGLAERVMAVLKERVDPQGQRNLEWRPIGNNRLEIRMPRPSKLAGIRRSEYDAAMTAIRDQNIRQDVLAAALHLNGESRASEIERLVLEVPSRRPLLGDLVAKYDAWRDAVATGEPKKIEPAEEDFTAAQDAVLATNIDLTVLSDMLAMDSGTDRTRELARFKERHPQQRGLIEAAERRYDEWAKDKGTLEDPADLERLLRGAGVLEFRLMAEKDRATAATILASEEYLREPIAKYAEQLRKRGPRPQAGDRYRWFKMANPVSFLNVEDRAELDNWERVQADSPLVVDRYGGAYYVLAHDAPRNTMLHAQQSQRKWSLKQAFASRDPRTNRPAVDFTLDARGGQLFYELTSANVGRQLGIFLDDQAVSSATIRSAIRESGQISGDFTRERVNELVNKLEAGALPARLKDQPLMVKSIGPSLGAENIRRGLQSGIWATIAVMAAMAVYYLLAGFVANTALMMNLLLTLAVMAWLQATLTMPGIAGLILVVGMSVDANVLIYERMREEFRRGATLRMAIRNGYDKAFSAIFDSNLTTLISCVILGYVGTEEIKGFALTLGFGVATSMFTALFVTRLIFQSLTHLGWIKRLPMLSFPGLHNANLDWMRLWRYFWPVSGALLIAGFVAFDLQPKTHLYDIEFLGGTSAQLDLKTGVNKTDGEVRRLITSKGPDGAAGWLVATADKMDRARAEASGTGLFTVRAEGIPAEVLDTLLSANVFSRFVQPGSLAVEGSGVQFVTRSETSATAESIAAGLKEVAAYVREAADRLAGAKVQLIGEVRGTVHQGESFEVVTTETDKKLVRDAIVAAMGDDLDIDRTVGFADIPDATDEAHVFPIPTTATLLSEVIGGSWTFNVQPYRDGVAFVLDDLQPAQTLRKISNRLRDMRLQPDFERYEWRETHVVGLTPAGREGDEETFTRMAVLVADPNLAYSDDADAWRTNLAEPELNLIKAALGTERSLQKVLLFAPSVADQAKQRAYIAIGLACLAMACYLWFRFGSFDYGLAAVIALLHDLAIAVGMVALSYYVSRTLLGSWLMIDDFRIDLAMVAAFLTVLGYSVNDTIVVFDRIRENRGKLASLSVRNVNASINQTLARTLLTGVTTLIVVSIMYVMGGSGIHGFNYVLLVGILVGTYSSIAIASPLLLNRHMMRAAVYAVLTLVLLGFALSLSDPAWKYGLSAAVVLGGAVVIGRQLRLGRPAGAPSVPAVAPASQPA